MVVTKAQSSDEGMRMRRSFAVVKLLVTGELVIVIAGMAVAPAPEAALKLDAEDMVGSGLAIKETLVVATLALPKLLDPPVPSQYAAIVLVPTLDRFTLTQPMPSVFVARR